MKSFLIVLVVLSALGAGAAMAQPLPAQPGSVSGDSAKSYKLCPRCGVANLLEARFCYSCGASFESGAVPAILPGSARVDTSQAGFCPVCGAARSPEAKFCYNCGASFTNVLSAGVPRKIESGPKKEPGIALCLSLLIPGAGQVYNSQAGKGGVQFVLYGVGWAVTLTGVNSDPPAEGIGFSSTMLVGLGISVFAWGWSVVDAPLSALAINHRRGYSALISPGVGLVFVPDPRNPRRLQPGVGLRAGF